MAAQVVMMKKLILGVLFLCLIPAVANARFKEETVWIPMVDEGVFWDSDIVLEATLYKPKGEGPFPVVIFNHGSTGPGAIPEDLTINPWGFGEYLNNKDIALLIPMRRGRGKSGGSYSERYECSDISVKKGIEYASKSLDATFNYLNNQNWVNKEKIIISGHSRGGILSTIYVSENPKAAIGVINFSGGWTGDNCVLNDGNPANVELFETAGQKTKVPNLFIYGSNDNYYTDVSIERYAKVFKDSGGIVDFQFYPINKGSNGHAVFYEFGYLWGYTVDAFLEQQGMVLK